MKIIRRTLGGDDAPLADMVTVTKPGGTTLELDLKQSSPGLFETTFIGDELGLYRLEQGHLSFVIGLGPAAPREFVETVATSKIVASLGSPKRGGMLGMQDGAPNVRLVRAGGNAAGANWIGLVPRGAYITTGVAVSPLIPAWVLLAAIAMLSIAAWLREGRR